MSQQKVRIEIPDGYSPQERQAIGKELVELIRQRTERGIGVRQRGGKFVHYDFPAYSKEYIKSLDFKIAGKSKNRIDLSLSGDMLIAMDLLSHDPRSVVIGFQAGTAENEKAEGNQLGAYGGSPNSRKARSFLGVTDQELASVLSKYPRRRTEE